MLRAPFSSEFDPSEEAEGSIDPLGLQPGYERLPDRSSPAVTVRMEHPRFVTAMALGACVCEGWDADAISVSAFYVCAGERVPSTISLRCLRTRSHKKFASS